MLEVNKSNKKSYDFGKIIKVFNANKSRVLGFFHSHFTGYGVSIKLYPAGFAISFAWRSSSPLSSESDSVKKILPASSEALAAST